MHLRGEALVLNIRDSAIDESALLRLAGRHVKNARKHAVGAAQVRLFATNYRTCRARYGFVHGFRSNAWTYTRFIVSSRFLLCSWTSK